MQRKTIDDKIEKLDDKIKQLVEQKKQLEARSKEKERKERTRRLIQIGAILDSIGIDSTEKADMFKELFEKDKNLNDYIFKKIINNDHDIDVEAK